MAKQVKIFLERDPDKKGERDEFLIVRVQNTLAPLVGGNMTSAQVQDLIDQNGIDVIIDPVGRRKMLRDRS